MKKMLPVEELARDERFQHVRIEDTVFDPRNLHPDANTNGLAPKPAGMATQFGVTVGTTVADLLKAYPAAHLNGGDDPSAELSEDLVVFVTSIAPSGRVTKLVGGTACTK